MKKHISDIRGAITIIDGALKDIENIIPEKTKEDATVLNLEKMKFFSVNEEIFARANQLKQRIDDHPIGSKDDLRFINSLFIDMGKLIHLILA